MPRDEKYLLCRNGIWYIHCRLPVRMGGGWLRVSCKTTRYDIAAGIRDRNIIPLFAAASTKDLLISLLQSISGAHPMMEQYIADLAAELDLPHLEGIKSSSVPGVPLEEAWAAFLGYLSSTGSLAAGTLTNYTGSARVWCHMLGADADAQTIDKDAIVAARNELMTLPRSYFIGDATRKSRIPVNGGATISATTIAMHLRALTAMYDWAIADGVLFCSNVSNEVKIKVGDVPEPVAPTAAEADALCNLPCPGSVGPVSWQYLPLVQRYTGTRWQEAVALTRDDIVMESGVRCLYIRPITRNLKNAQSKRLVPISDKLAVHVDELLALTETDRLFTDAGDKVFANNIKLGQIMNKRWNTAAKAIGPFSTKHWRIYAINQMASGNVDIIDRERIVGHKNDRTHAAYTASDMQRYKAAVDKIT